MQSLVGRVGFRSPGTALDGLESILLFRIVFNSSFKTDPLWYLEVGKNKNVLDHGELALTSTSRAHVTLHFCTGSATPAKCLPYMWLREIKHSDQR